VDRKPTLPELPKEPFTKELAEQMIERVIAVVLPQLTAGLTLPADSFLRREDLLREALYFGVTIGERYTHEKPTVPAPDRLIDRMRTTESGVLPTVNLRPPPRKVQR
jgi:hypothetical protein